ncbi:MAG: homoserine dehydrogenase [Candidatus Sumerlaeota bacterium]|nr:homoserine dehydrogenase [Candidatus Sumerlaeota bacterium]
MPSPLNVGLIGFGNIGAGVVRLLHEHAELIAERCGRPIRLARIADIDTTTKRDCPDVTAILSSDTDGLLADPQIDAVIELIGGYEPARTFVERALRAGKSVVTANKAMLARHGADLMAAAPKGASLLYEAAVGGGIPLIRAIDQGLAANRIRGIRGIVNGTTNFILTRMEAKGVRFKEALAEAQKRGYAEPDPTLDVNGTDTAHKIALLAAQCFQQDIRIGDIKVEGIESLTPTDFAYAKELDYKIKLLGIAKSESPDGPVEVRVSPTLLPASSLLGQVPGVYNAIEIDGEPVGPTLYYGQGAGPKATSSAVASDLMALAACKGNQEPPMRLRIPVGKKNLKPIEDIVTEYYLRFLVTDKPGTMAALSRVLGENNISIRSMIQHGRERAENATVILITHAAREGNVQKALQAIRALEVNKSDPFVLRVEEV